MPIVPPADMLPNPVFYPCFTCPKRDFLRQKSAEKNEEKGIFRLKKNLKTAPTAPISKICLTH